MGDPLENEDAQADELLEGLPEGEETEDSGSVEDLAGELGWKPDGELDAKGFILKSRDIQDTMRGHIKAQKEQLSDLSGSVEALKVHNEKVYKAEVNQLTTELDALKKEKIEAIEEGDVERVGEIEEKMDGVKDAISKPEQKQESSNSEFDAWAEANPWFNTDAEMTEYANGIADANPGAPFKRLTALVTKKIKEMFPDKFEKPQEGRLSGSPVEGGGRKSTSSKFTKADLSSNQRSVMAQFVRQGIMTEKAYIADIQKTQGA